MNIIVRFRLTFRERAPEWVMALILTLWGGILLLPGRSFDQPYFAALASIGSEIGWGALTVLVGLTRFAALYINGSRWWTPIARMAGCLFSMMIWSFLTMGALSVPWRSPGVATYAGLFLLDALMLSFATRDLQASVARREAFGNGNI